MINKPTADRLLSRHGICLIRLRPPLTTGPFLGIMEDSEPPTAPEIEVLEQIIKLNRDFFGGGENAWSGPKDFNTVMVRKLKGSSWQYRRFTYECFVRVSLEAIVMQTTPTVKAK